jgi:hypothetical protein
LFKLTFILDPIWYYSSIKQQLYFTTQNIETRVYNSWIKQTSSDRLNIILYTKQTINYIADENVVESIDFTHTHFSIYVISCNGEVKLLSNPNVLWSIYLLEYENKYYVIQRQSNSNLEKIESRFAAVSIDNNNVTCDLLHLEKPINDTPLLFSLSSNIDKDWIDKWNTQYWPTFDDVWKSYVKKYSFTMFITNFKLGTSNSNIYYQL